MSFSELGSLTILLSEGDRPVFAPEYAVKAPDEEIAVPISYTFVHVLVRCGMLVAEGIGAAGYSQEHLRTVPQ